MDKSRWLLGLLFVQIVSGQVQNLTTDKNGNVVSPAGAKFGTGIPLRVVDAPSGGTDVVNKTYADSLVTGGVTVFTSLTDVPSSYVGQTGKFVTVKTTENGLEFTSLSTLSANIVSDAVYDATLWNGDTTHAPSKNAVRDKIESMSVGGGVSITATAPMVITPSPLTGTGVISLGVADTTHNGYLTSTDWNTFNGKQNTITPSALTKSDDTNITLALGGAPTTALLGAVSITAGWTGTLAVSRGGIGGSTAPAHQYFGNNTGSTAAPGFHQIDYSELSGTPTVPTDVSALHFVTTQAESGLSNEFSLGSLASGLLKQTVAAGVSTPSIATAGTDYEVPLTFSQSVSRATNTVTLSGDSASPGNTMLYGTNGSGTKGWYAQSSGGASVANPGSQLLGLTAINGSAATAMRSDGAPALNQGITPTWTGLHTWKFSDGTSSVKDVISLAHNGAGGGSNQGVAILFNGSNATPTDDIPFARIGAFMNTGVSSGTTCLQFGNILNGSAVTNRMVLSGAGGLDVGASPVNTIAAGVIRAGVGFQIASNAGSGNILQGNGTNFVASTPTWPTTAGAAGYTIRSDATNFASYPAQLINSSVTSQSPTTADVYLAGSNIVVTAGDMKAKGQYKCVFDMTKSAGTGAIVITLRVGTAGTTSDAAIQTYTFGAGTSVADTGIFEVIATWRTVGIGTSAVIQSICRGTHQLATTGLFNNAAGWVLIGSPSPSAGFSSSSATNIGLSFNGSTAFAGTATLVQAQLQQ